MKRSAMNLHRTEADLTTTINDDMDGLRTNIEAAPKKQMEFEK